MWEKPVPALCVHCDSQSAIARALNSIIFLTDTFPTCFPASSGHLRRRWVSGLRPSHRALSRDVLTCLKRFRKFDSYTLCIMFFDERFYFGDQVLPCFETGIPLLKQRLHQLPDADNISVAFPDDGAWKRFHKQLEHFPTVVCTKVREGDKRFVRLKEGSVASRHVVIVDDLVQSGGTLIECQKVLAAEGAAKVSAYVTHGVFPKQSWERFMQTNEAENKRSLTYFWITDSCPQTAKAIENKSPFEVISLHLI
ncbi:hypothetical protein ACHQM5_004610 [Ranunculus cassubicifolius]